MSGRILEPKTLEVFSPLWERSVRYKGTYGGRGSGKSHDRAQAVIISMFTRPGCRVVCVREVQNSIKDSVKQLLEDTIERLGVRREFEVLRDEIRGPKGSLCIFRGMNDQNSDSIKSLEGYDISWWEEAQTASARSLQLLRPTLRKPGAELWFTWNPRLRTDAVDLFFRADPPEESVVVKSNWDDNKWFPAGLDLDRRIDEGSEAYGHVWLGEYEKVSDQQFISGGLVSAAFEAEAISHSFDEVILGVDVGGEGRHGDETVIAVRRGRDARSEPWMFYRGLNTMEIAARVSDAIERIGPDAVFIDSGGIGKGVCDRLRQLRQEIIPVDFGSSPSGLTTAKTANKRAEMWQRMKDWLAQGSVATPVDIKLESQLTSVESSHDRNNAILLESKSSPRRLRLGLPSPDRADALALTFAYTVAKRGDERDRTEERGHGRSYATGY